jgi:hypothetical protein
MVRLRDAYTISLLGSPSAPQMSTFDALNDGPLSDDTLFDSQPPLDPSMCVCG